jgi:hypothetical protein
MTQKKHESTVVCTDSKSFTSFKFFSISNNMLVGFVVSDDDSSMYLFRVFDA